VRQFIVDNFLFGEGEQNLSNEDSFLEKGIVDSMGILTLVSFVQGKYGFEVPDQDLVPGNWDSVALISAYVQSKVGVGG
jgi:acyl carrier protein